MHVTPYYNKTSQEGLYQHFKACAQAADLPVIDVYKRQNEGRMTWADVVAAEASRMNADSTQPKSSNKETWVNSKNAVNLTDAIKEQFFATAPGKALLVPDAPSNMIYFFAVSYTHLTQRHRRGGKDTDDRVAGRDPGTADAV